MRWFIVAMVLSAPVAVSQEVPGAPPPPPEVRADQSAEWGRRVGEVAEDIRVQIEQALAPLRSWGDKTAEPCAPGERPEPRERALDVRRRRQDVAGRVEDLKRQLDRANPEVAEVLTRNIALHEKMAAALDERLAAHETRDGVRADEAERCLASLENELGLAEVDLMEARATTEIRERAQREGVTVSIEPLLAELREAFAGTREVRKQIAALREEEAKLGRRIDLVNKRFELLALKQETERLEKEVSTR